MSTSLSNLVSNLSEKLHNDRSYLDYMTIKDEQLIFNCFSCKNSCTWISMASLLREYRG